MKDLPPEVKKQRLNKLLELKADCKKNFALNMASKTLSVLLEEVKDGYAEGYSENYLRIYVQGAMPDGKIKKVMVIEPFKDGALAQIKEN